MKVIDIEVGVGGVGVEVRGGIGWRWKGGMRENVGLGEVGLLVCVGSEVGKRSVGWVK